MQAQVGYPSFSFGDFPFVIANIAGERKHSDHYIIMVFHIFILKWELTYISIRIGNYHRFILGFIQGFLNRLFYYLSFRYRTNGRVLISKHIELFVKYWKDDTLFYLSVSSVNITIPQPTRDKIKYQTQKDCNKHIMNSELKN